MKKVFFLCHVPTGTARKLPIAVSVFEAFVSLKISELFTCVKLHYIYILNCLSLQVRGGL